MKYFLPAVRPKKPITNLGDEVQSLASAPFLPRVDGVLDINRLFHPDETPFKEKTFSIYHGFAHYEHSNPICPSPNFNPFITSLHLPDYSMEMVGKHDHLLDYFRAHQPIGCRDFATRDFFRKHNVEAYFSGCLTLTLDRSRFTQPNQKREGIIFADSPGLKSEEEILWGKEARWIGHHCDMNEIYYDKQNWIKKMFNSKEDFRRPEKEILDPESNLMLDPESDFSIRMKKAEALLSLYANAELVVTARLHVALPCLAFDTPVLFTHYFDKNIYHPIIKPFSDSRFGGLIEHTNTIAVKYFLEDLEKGEWEINGTRTAWHEIKNPNTHQPIADKLADSVRAAVKNVSA